MSTDGIRLVVGACQGAASFPLVAKYKFSNLRRFLRRFDVGFSGLSGLFHAVGVAGGDDGVALLQESFAC